jgi:rhodanese-related sulfurtransferase
VGEPGDSGPGAKQAPPPGALTALLRAMAAEPRIPSRLTRLASFLARLFGAAPRSPTAQPPHPSADVVAELSDVLTPEEQHLLVLRLDRELPWREVAEIMAEGGRLPRETEVRQRFEQIKEKLRLMAKEHGRGPTEARAEREPFGQLAVAEVARLVGDPSARLFDLRSPRAFSRGHLPGATRISPDDVQRNLPADSAVHLVYYGENTRDLSCHGAARAASQAGYSKVFIMPAGLDGWREAGRRVETEV